MKYYAIFSCSNIWHERKVIEILTVARDLASNDSRWNVGQWSCSMELVGLLIILWGTELLWNLHLFTSSINNTVLPGFSSSLGGFQHLACHFIVLLCLVYGWTVPLNRVLLNPAEHKLMPPRCWRARLVFSAELSELPLWFAPFWTPLSYLLVV